MTRRILPPEVRFWAKVDKSGDCWLWTARLSHNGYGRFVNQAAHRTAYEMLVGPIPEGMQLDHLCRVRRCVNPSHLEPVTPRENLMRSENQVAKHAAKTHCPHGHPYSGRNLYISPRGHRVCRACSHAGDLARREIEKEKRRGARAAMPPQTHCKRGHLLEWRNGRSHCKPCRNLTQRQRRQARLRREREATQ